MLTGNPEEIHSSEKPALGRCPVLLFGALCGGNVVSLHDDFLHRDFWPAIASGSPMIGKPSMAISSRLLKSVAATT